jgi:hypothetical protein
VFGGHMTITLEAYAEDVAGNSGAITAYYTVMVG